MIYYAPLSCHYISRGMIEIEIYLTISYSSFVKTIVYSNESTEKRKTVLYFLIRFFSYIQFINLIINLQLRLGTMPSGTWR